MTPKERAKYLVDKFFLSKEIYGSFYMSDAKVCSLIAVDEICEAINWHEFDKPNKELDYWQEVKQEIQKL